MWFQVNQASPPRHVLSTFGQLCPDRMMGWLAYANSGLPGHQLWSTKLQRLLVLPDLGCFPNNHTAMFFLWPLKPQKFLVIFHCTLTDHYTQVHPSLILPFSSGNKEAINKAPCLGIRWVAANSMCHQMWPKHKHTVANLRWILRAAELSIMHYYVYYDSVFPGWLTYWGRNGLQL